MELTYGIFYVQGLGNAIKGMCAKKVTAHWANQIGNLKLQMDKNFAALQKRYKAIVDEYAELDEKGNTIPDANNFGVKLKDYQAAEKAAAILHAEKFILKDFKKIPVNILGEISADDIILLKPFLKDLEIVEGENE